MADKPTFSINDSFEREQTYIPGPGDWDFVDTYNQEYSLGWSEVYSSRLSVGLNFKLQLEDVIQSFGVDNKTVTISTDGSLKSLIWDLGFDWKDKISYTNEFNIPRRDEIEYGLEFNFLPYYFPPFKMKIQRLWDEQESLEDKTEEKLEINTEYGIGNSLDFSLAWKETQVDDRLIDNSDTDNEEWSTSLNYSKSLLPTLKLDFKTEYDGSRNDTLDNAGSVLNTDKAKNLQHNLKVTFESFPNLTSSLEIASDEDFVLEEKGLNFDFSASSDQQLVSLGTITEKVDVSRDNRKSDLVDSQENTFDFSLELAGTPQKYTDYSVKYELNMSDTLDNFNPANDTDTREDVFDISLTLVPVEKATIESSFNWSSTRTDGSKSGTERNLKFKGTFGGEIFNIPNLVFTPKLTINQEEDLAGGTSKESTDLELGFVYVPYLPPTASWDLETTYKWSKGDNVDTELEFKSDFALELPNPVWDLSFKESSSTTFDLENNEPNFWTHDLEFIIGSDLTRTIALDANYKYKYDDENQDDDELEINLEWEFLASSLSFKFSQGRIFEGPKDVNRTYLVEFFMDF
jgi:hypothetical protein